MIMEMWINLHSSAGENIKWPFVKPTFVVHGGQSALRFLSDSSSLLIIPCQATTSRGSGSDFLSWRCYPRALRVLTGSARLASTQSSACQFSLVPILTPVRVFLPDCCCLLLYCWSFLWLSWRTGVPSSLYLDSLNWQVIRLITCSVPSSKWHLSNCFIGWKPCKKSY